MKWIFVCIGIAMVIIGGIGKYVDITKYKEDFISGNSPFYTIFMTGIITIILGLSFDWILSLDDEEEGEESAKEGKEEASAEEQKEESTKTEEAPSEEPSQEQESPPTPDEEKEGETT